MILIISDLYRLYKDDFQTDWIIGVFCGTICIDVWSEIVAEILGISNFMMQSVWMCEVRSNCICYWYPTASNTIYTDVWSEIFLHPSWQIWIKLPFYHMKITKTCPICGKQMYNIIKKSLLDTTHICKCTCGYSLAWIRSNEYEQETKEKDQALVIYQI